MNYIHFFWIAEYDDGNVLIQFDPKTGKENLYKQIDFNKLVKFGWYPFTLSLSEKVSNSIINPLIHNYIINVKKDDGFFARRRNYIRNDGKTEKRYTEYLLGNKYIILTIQENGNCEIKYNEEK